MHKCVEPIIKALEKVIVEEFDVIGLPPPEPSIYGKNKGTQKIQAALKGAIKKKLIKNQS